MLQEPLGAVTLEGLDRLVFGQAEAIIGPGEPPAPIFGALPELPAVVPQEERLVLLGLVSENRAAPTQNLLGTERHREIDLIQLPLGPRPAIEPEFRLLEPGLARAAAERVAQRVEAEPVSAVRIVEVARGKDQMRLQILEQLTHHLHVAFAQLPAADGGGVVEGQIKEMEPVRWHAADMSGGVRLMTADQRLPLRQLSRSGQDTGCLVRRTNPLDPPGRDCISLYRHLSEPVQMNGVPPCESPLPL